MSFEQLKQAELIRFTLQLRNAHDAEYRREVTERLDDTDKTHWLTPDEFERRLGSA